MPMNRTPDYPAYMMELFEHNRSYTRVQPIYLGGSSGSNGGNGEPPGGFVGKLSQKYVTYDSTEAETMAGSSTLVDNLNHIRWRITNMSTGSGGSSGSLSNATPEPVGTAYSGVSGLGSRSDHVHAHGNQTGSTFHSLASQTANGFLRTTASTSGSYLDSTNNWSVPTGTGGSGATVTYSSTPALPLGASALAGTSGSISRYDHVHTHGVLSDGTLHSLASQAGAGFIRTTPSTTGSYLDSTNNWSVPSASSTPPSSAPPLSLVDSDTGQPGTSGSFSRADHQHSHGIITFDNAHSDSSFGYAGFVPTPPSNQNYALMGLGGWVHVRSDGTPEPVGAAGLAGTSGSLSRSDHVHAGAQVSSTLPQNITISSGSAGTATTASRVDHVHSHGNLGPGSDLHALADDSNSGFIPAIPDDSGYFLDGTLNWSEPPGGSPTPLSSVAALKMGTAAAGSSGSASRGDHVHPKTDLISTNLPQTLSQSSAATAGTSGSASDGAHIHAITSSSNTSTTGSGSYLLKSNASGGLQLDSISSGSIIATSGQVVAQRQAYQYGNKISGVVLQDTYLSAGSAASFTFTVPSNIGLSNLIIKGSVGSWAAQATVPMYMTVNGFALGYYGMVFSTNTATAGSASQTLNATSFSVAINGGTSSGSFSQVEVHFNDALNTLKLPSWDFSSNGMFTKATLGQKWYEGSGYLDRAGAITTITFTTVGGFRQYSRMELEGEF